jgi:hypothetical protein
MSIPIMKFFILLSLAVAGAKAITVAKSSLVTRDPTTNNIATVDLAVSRGNPKHLASGFIYRIPDTPNQIPDHWYCTKTSASITAELEELNYQLQHEVGFGE